MALDLELYTHPLSPCAQKVRIVLAEKALDWQPHFVSLPDKDNLKPEYLALNPLGVVPTLIANGEPIIESSIICEFLEDQYPEVPLRPNSSWQTARMRFWMKHVDVKLHPSCGAIQWPMVMREGLLSKTPQEQQAILDQIPEKPRRERQRRLLKHGLDAPDVADAVRTYRKTALDMEADLCKTDWIVGDHFSLADAALAPYFQTLEQFCWAEIYAKDCPNVSRWFAACKARPSYALGVMDDYADVDLDALAAAGRQQWPKIAQHLPA